MKQFRITALSGSIEILLTSQQERWYGECLTDEARRGFIGHEAWRKLWESSAQTMLRRLCDDIGVDAAKARFISGIKIEEV